MSKFTSEIKKLPQSKLEITVGVPAGEMAVFWDQAAEGLAKTLTIKGFRPGKAPRDIVEKTVGTEKFFNEAAEVAVKKTYLEIVQNNNLEPIGHPEIAILKIAPGEEFQYRLTVTVLPEAALPDYRNLVRSMALKAVKVEEKELSEAVDWLRESRAKTSAVTRPAKMGDLVEIDFEIGISGVAVNNGSSKNQPVILGSHKLVPGFEENLVGMAKGDEKQFSLEVPAGFWEKNLAGKMIGVRAKMNRVEERELPEANDDLAKSLGRFETMEALKNSIREGFLAEKETKEKERFRIEVADKIAGVFQVEIPDMLIDLEVEKMINELEADIEGHGMDFADYLGQLKKTVAGLKTEFREPALRRVKIALVLRRIAEEQNLAPAAGEVEEKMNEFLKQHGDVKAVKEKFDLPELYEKSRAILANEKVFQYLESLTLAKK